MPRRKKTKEEISYNMSRVRSQGSRIEMLLGRELRRAGLRFQKQYPVIGRPDFALPSLKIAVFCDSNFWHGRNWGKGAESAIKSNRGFWLPKIQRNLERDRAVTRELKRQGWAVLRFWEDEIVGDPGGCVTQVAEEVQRRRRDDPAARPRPHRLQA